MPRTIYISRNLPTQIYLSWLEVRKAFVRSAQQGKCEALHERLRQQWRLLLKRVLPSSGALTDSYYHRGRPQGGKLAFDASKKVTGAPASSAEESTVLAADGWQLPDYWCRCMEPRRGLARIVTHVLIEGL